jgi:hypothetical protein
MPFETYSGRVIYSFNPKLLVRSLDKSQDGQLHFGSFDEMNFLMKTKVRTSLISSPAQHPAMRATFQSPSSYRLQDNGTPNLLLF